MLQDVMYYITHTLVAQLSGNINFYIFMHTLIPQELLIKTPISIKHFYMTNKCTNKSALNIAEEQINWCFSTLILIIYYLYLMY